MIAHQGGFCARAASASDNASALQKIVITNEFRMAGSEKARHNCDPGPNDWLTLFPFGAIGPETGFGDNGTTGPISAPRGPRGDVRFT